VTDGFRKLPDRFMTSTGRSRGSRNCEQVRSEMATGAVLTTRDLTIHIKWGAFRGFRRSRKQTRDVQLAHSLRFSPRGATFAESAMQSRGFASVALLKPTPSTHLVSFTTYPSGKLHILTRTLVDLICCSTSGKREPRAVRAERPSHTDRALKL